MKNLGFSQVDGKPHFVVGKVESVERGLKISFAEGHNAIIISTLKFDNGGEGAPMFGLETTESD